MRGSPRSCHAICLLCSTAAATVGKAQTSPVPHRNAIFDIEIISSNEASPYDRAAPLAAQRTVERGRPFKRPPSRSAQGNESLLAKSIQRMGHLTKLRDGFADGSTDRAQAEKVLANFEVTYQLVSASIGKCTRG